MKQNEKSENPQTEQPFGAAIWLGRWLFSIFRQSFENLFSFVFNASKNCVMSLKTCFATIIYVSIAGCSESALIPPSNIFSHFNNFCLESRHGSILRSEYIPFREIFAIHPCYSASNSSSSPAIKSRNARRRLAESVSIRNRFPKTNPRKRVNKLKRLNPFMA
jgi:hypothetical protein